MAKTLIIIGVILIMIGVMWYFFADKLSFIGNLPGDIKIEREHFKFYFPLTTMLLVSIFIHLVMRVLKYFS